MEECHLQFFKYKPKTKVRRREREFISRFSDGPVSGEFWVTWRYCGEIHSCPVILLIRKP